MYTKDKNQRITLRLSEAQFSFVSSNADILGVSPSEFLRMIVNGTMVAAKQAEQLQYSVGQKMAMESNTDERLGKGRENDKADIDNIV